MSLGNPSLCNTPGCGRVVYHAGQHRPTWLDVPLCGAWMPYVKAPCAKRAGHRSPEHRSRYAMDNERNAYWRAYWRAVA